MLCNEFIHIQIPSSLHLHFLFRLWQVSGFWWFLVVLPSCSDQTSSTGCLQADSFTTTYYYTTGTFLIGKYNKYGFYDAEIPPSPSAVAAHPLVPDWEGKKFHLNSGMEPARFFSFLSLNSITTTKTKQATTTN